MGLPIKNEFGVGILELSRVASTEYVTSSGIMSDKPCWILSVLVTATDVASAALCYLRNGEVVTSDILIPLVGQYARMAYNGAYPIYFNRGLYVELNSNVAGVTVQYLQNSP